MCGNRQVFTRIALSLIAVCSLLALAGCTSSPEPATRPATGQRPSPTPDDAGPGAALRITHFYANAGYLRPGQQVVLCYGVEGAAEVRLEPPVAAVRPVSNRCVGVSPASTTTYRLTAKDAAGAAVSQTLTLRVAPAAPAADSPSPTPVEQDPLILFFSASATQARRGQPVTVCYGAEGAVKLELSPPLRTLEPAARSCFVLSLPSTTTLRLKATREDGASEAQELQIRIQE